MSCPIGIIVGSGLSRATVRSLVSRRHRDCWVPMASFRESARFKLYEASRNSVHQTRAVDLSGRTEQAYGVQPCGYHAVVLIDHGSRRDEANCMLQEFAKVYVRTSGREIVECAHMEIAEPTLLQAVEACVAQGATEIVVAPYFLSNGRHVQVDIPEQVKEARFLFPGIRIRCADPIGVDALMAEVIERRVQAVLS